MVTFHQRLDPIEVIGDDPKVAFALFIVLLDLSDGEQDLFAGKQYEQSSQDASERSCSSGENCRVTHPVFPQLRPRRGTPSHNQRLFGQR